MVAVLVGDPAAAAAQASPPKLGITPVGQRGSFFELSMAPGARRELAVELSNQGSGTVAALTYRSEVYTIINGGLGARLRGEAGGGTSSWLDYPTDVVQLRPGSGIRRTFSVAVPPGTPPGEYIASVVVENSDPLKGSGPVALDQIVRQAIAVAITVPGPARPGLDIGEARHGAVAGRSILGVAVRNTGKLRLRPAGELVLFDDSGERLGRWPVTMDSFYAGTDTHVEVPLGRLLDPGRYRLSLSLTDPERGASASRDSIVLDVPELDKGAIGAAPAEKPGQARGRDGLPAWALIGAGVTLLLAGMALTLGVSALVRRHRARAGAGPGEREAPR